MVDDFPDHQFVKVEKVIEKVLKQNNLQELLYFSKILKHWELIVGTPLSKKAIPLKLSRRVLLVGVADPAYSHHLRFFEPNILELIASPEICGEGAVKKVVFKTVQQSAFVSRHSNQDVTEKPLKLISEADKAQIVETARKISDQQLQKVFSRYMGKIVSK